MSTVLPSQRPCSCGHLRMWHSFLSGRCEFRGGRNVPACDCAKFEEAKV